VLGCSFGLVGLKKQNITKQKKKQEYNSDVTQQLTTDKFCAKRFLIIPTKIAKLNIKTSISKTAGIEIAFWGIISRLDHNLRGPHIPQQQLSIDIRCGPALELSSKPAGRRHRCCCCCC